MSQLLPIIKSHRAMAKAIGEVADQCVEGSASHAAFTLMAYAYKLAADDLEAQMKAMNCQHPEGSIQPVIGKVATYECSDCGAEVTITRSRKGERE